MRIAKHPFFVLILVVVTLSTAAVVIQSCRGAEVRRKSGIAYAIASETLDILQANHDAAPELLAGRWKARLLLSSGFELVPADIRPRTSQVVASLRVWSIEDDTTVLILGEGLAGC